MPLPLIRLLYSSQAADGMTYSILVGIMAHAQTKNTARGITGILCYGSGQFLQALEGERDAVNALYHEIAADARHGSCQLMAVEEIAQRAFPEWTMKVVNWEDGDSARRRAMLEADTGLSVFSPQDMAAAHAATFLEHLAEMERELGS
ncbi:BLUF domain-containing protein [Gemmatimonas phototrophica]|nr:BLUF domain-containing protein [Gemmatimonas phototrophica]